MFRKSLFFLLLVPMLLAGCVKVPEGVAVVDDFELDRYLGTWYEIARLENSFEKDFTSVTATYSLAGDGSVEVLNRGYDSKEGAWKETRAKAKFAGAASTGELRVYNIIALDTEGYQWAMVCGYKKSLFRILSRQPEMDDELYTALLEKARSMGFDTDNLVVNTPVAEVTDTVSAGQKS